jgi:peptide/nickel transport system ATP-binding protein
MVEHIFDYPTHPYTLGLFGSLPKLESTEARLKPIKGLMPDPTKLPEGCRFCERCPDATEECEKSPPDVTQVAPGHLVKCFYAGVKK